ncbi:heavy-metal-associated domain-containing protein [Bacillus piscicola]|uniref:heavy-metal-associated domain-containing protein n=1 Tax=Bacillus piscicola TaxID=1632684 RepID=UPI001F08C3B8|nr:hypothetical protein [Bacillus piscicola]
MVTRTLSIVDMSAADEKRIHEALYDVWGVRNVTLHPEKGTAIISFNDKAASFTDFEQAVRDSGFEVAEHTSHTEMEES